MHTHHPEKPINSQVVSKARLILTVLILPVLLAAVFGMMWFWPASSSLIGSRPFLAPGVKIGLVQVSDKNVKNCLNNLKGPFAQKLNTEGQNDAAGANQDLLKDAVCARVIKGIPPIGGIVPVHVPVEKKQAIHQGTKIKVLYDTKGIGAGTPYIYWDIYRDKPMLLLGMLYVLLVLAIAGLRGARALIGLLASTLVLVFFIIPAIINGSPPILVTLIGAVVMMVISVYFAHGITIRTTTALLGTFIGLIVTVILAYWGSWEAGLIGAEGDTAQMVSASFPHLWLPAIFTCGAVIAGLGALNDVTITQAAAVWELDTANPTLNIWRLFRHAMVIGRDHIASTVYTLAFAYAGTALPALMLAVLINRSYVDLLTVSEIAEEIVRTLVASIGLVVAIPATTIIAVFLVKISRGVWQGITFKSNKLAG